MTAKKKLKDLMLRRQVGQTLTGKDRKVECVSDEEAHGEWEDGMDKQSEEEDQNADGIVPDEEEEHMDVQRPATAKSRLQELLRHKRQQALAAEEEAGSRLEANDDEEKDGSIGAARHQSWAPGSTPGPESSGSASRPVVPDSDSDDDDEEEEGTTFSSLLRNLKMQIRGAATDKPPKKEKEAEAGRLQDTVASAVAAAREEAARRTTAPVGLEVGEVDHERKAAAQRTLELLEARRLGDLAADNAGRKTGRRRNNTDKRCERDFTRSRLDEELAAQERGPRYVNNTAVFLRKGEKTVDTRKIKTNAVEKADGSLDMTVHKFKTREERLTEIQQGLR